MLPDYGHLGGWVRSEFRFTRAQVSLDPDVREYFGTSKEVNDALRTLIAESRVPARK
jgi:hypothetical protein